MAASTTKFVCKFSAVFRQQRRLTVQVGQVNKFLRPQCCSYSTEANEGNRWQLWSAVCLERPAVTMPDLIKLEQDYMNVLMQLEAENSHLSEHEVRHVEDAKMTERSKGEDYEESEADVSRQTAHDAEDIWETEFNQFKPADKLTEADKNKDCKSIQRRLDKKLVLLLKQRLGENEQWLLPQGIRTEQESMRETAERVLASQAGTSLDVTFLGNAPCGFYKYKYPPQLQAETGSVGAKVFFFKAQYRKGNIQSSDEVLEHVWLSQDELEDYLLPKYHKSVHDFILGV